MTGPGIDQRIPSSTRLALDTSVLIAYLESGEDVSLLARSILHDFLETGRNDGVISALSVGEALVRPSRLGIARDVAFDIMDMPGLRVRSVDMLVGAEAARIRATSRLRMPDAVVIATGVMTSSHVLVTNDERLAAAVPQVVSEMQVVLLSDLV